MPLLRYAIQPVVVSLARLLFCHAFHVIIDLRRTLLMMLSCHYAMMPYAACRLRHFAITLIAGCYATDDMLSPLLMMIFAAADAPCRHAPL